MSLNKLRLEADGLVVGDTQLVARGGGVTVGQNLVVNGTTFSGNLQVNKLILHGSTSGSISLIAAAAAATSIISLPSGTGTVAVQGASTNIQSGVSQAATSGTAILFTGTNGVPSWANRITVFFNGVKTSGTATLQVQIGTGSVATSGYQSACVRINNGGTGLPAISFTTGFAVENAPANGSSTLRNGFMTIIPIGNNTYSYQSNINTASGELMIASGFISLPGVLDRINVTTSGTDTFAAGTINIFYE